MATIILGARLRKEHAASQLNALLKALGAILDALVANRMRRAAAEVEYGRPRRLLVLPTQTDNNQ